MNGSQESQKYESALDANLPIGIKKRKLKIRINEKNYNVVYINNKIKYLSRLVAEEVLGKPLSDKVEVHHYGKKSEDHKIVICENKSYHQLLHQRTRAYKACGHADWRKCWICKRYDNPNNLFIRKRCGSYHIECNRIYQNIKNNNKRENYHPHKFWFIYNRKFKSAQSAAYFYNIPKSTIISRCNKKSDKNYYCVIKSEQIEGH
jgi:hypothetical protein